MALFTPVPRWQPPFRPFGRVPAGERLLILTERMVKGPLFGCRMCGNCLLQETAFICHMQCPKGLRNGPCGGTRNGYCYVEPSRKCVWHLIYARSFRMKRENRLLEVLPPVDWDRAGRETWGGVVKKVSEAGIRNIIMPAARGGRSAAAVLEEKVFRPVRQPSWWNGDSDPHLPHPHEPVSPLERDLRNGKFVITSEVMPPLSSSLSLLRERIATVMPHVTSVNFTDGSSAIPRMSGPLCSTVAASMGADPVMQISARDNTRNSLQALAVAANAAGIFNIVCLSGDSPRVGLKPTGNLSIIDTDSVQMLWILRRMRDEGIYLDGREIKNRPKLFLGAAASPFALDPAMQIIRDIKKVNAGAQFFQTNLVFDEESIMPWLDQLDRRLLTGKVFILIGVSPLKSYEQARYLDEKIPGITIPSAIMDRMKRAGADAHREGIDIAASIITRLKERAGVSGVHIMPLGWEAAVPEIVSRVGA